jgi:hypothetical protein
MIPLILIALGLVLVVLIYLIVHGKGNVDEYPITKKKK